MLSGFWGTDTNQAQVAERFLLVHVNVGERRAATASLAQRFHVIAKAGLPIVVVATPTAQVVEVSREFLAGSQRERRRPDRIPEQGPLTFARTSHMAEDI